MNIDSSAFAVTIGSIAPALAIGIIGAAGLIGISRNPAAGDRIQVSMLIAIAFAEAIAIYALVMGLILKFA